MHVDIQRIVLLLQIAICYYLLLPVIIRHWKAYTEGTKSKPIRC